MQIEKTNFTNQFDAQFQNMKLLTIVMVQFVLAFNNLKAFYCAYSSNNISLKELKKFADWEI